MPNSNPRWKYQGLQPTAFAITRPGDLNHTYRLLRFPARWKSALAPLAPPPEPGQPPRIPIDSLNRTLIALVPDIITVAKSATRGQDPIWILSDRQINTDAVFAIVGAWVRVWAARNPVGAARALAQMAAVDLEWQEFAVDFAEQMDLCRSREDSPARDQARQAVFRLLPHQIAAALTTPGTGCVHGGDDEDVVESIFRRCPAGEGAEIMSWPPHAATTKPFSFTISLTAQTMPLIEDYRIHAHFKVRRWVHKTPYLDTAKNTSVYLNPSVPWVRGVEQSASFQRAGLRAVYTRNPETGKNEPCAVWGDMFAKVLTELRAVGHLATPEVLRTDPRSHLEAHNGGMGLVYHEGMYSFPSSPPKSHPAKPGLALTDRPRLLDWLASQTTPALELLAPMPRSAAVAIPGIDLRPARTDPVAQTTLRASIRTATGSTSLRIAVFYDTQRTFEYAVATLQDHLGVKFPLPDGQGQPQVDSTVTTDELTVTLEARPVGALGADLDPKAVYRKLEERLQEAVTRRARQIKADVDNLVLGEVGIALVEIAGLRTYKGKRRQNDPKFAIRHGMNLAGWLTQFLEPVQDKPDPADQTAAKPTDGPVKPAADGDAERLHNCWDELWRQLGARRTPIPEPDPALGKPRYLAFHIVRQNQTKTWGATRQVPIAVLMNHDGSGITVMAPDFKSGLPLHRALLEVGRHYVMGGQKRTPEEITKFFEEILTQELSLDQPILLLTNAQNTRPAWKFLDNGNLEPDALQFGEKKPVPLAHYPGLRHVRIRTDMREETPEGFAVRDANDDKGHTGALWHAGGRQWYSTADKPVTAGTTNRYISMVETVHIQGKGGTTREISPSPGAGVWNHQLIETAVVGRQDTDTDEVTELWAGLAHDLRLGHPSYKHATILAWPLHLAEQIGEYVVPLKLLEEVAEQENASTQTDPAAEGA